MWDAFIEAFAGFFSFLSGFFANQAWIAITDVFARWFGEDFRFGSTFPKIP